MNKIQPVFKDNFIVVALQSSNEYVPYLSVCLQSLVMNSSSDINYDIIVLEKDISNTNKNIISKQIIKENISLRFVDINDMLSRFNIKVGRHTINCFFKLFLPMILDNSYKKVIYLDTDIVVNVDISQLYNMKLDNAIAACRDLGILYNASSLGNKDMLNNLFIKPLGVNLNFMLNYFNTGVFIYNLEICRNIELAQKAISKAEEKVYHTSEQDIQNILLENNVTFLSFKWNYWPLETCINHFSNTDLTQFIDDFKESTKNPNIVHFAGGLKPWNTFDKSYFKDLWWKYARNTPYYEYFVENIIAKKFIIKEKEVRKPNADYHSIPATIRIQNQLSYKLGRLIIENSKSILGWIKMPFSIISAIREHKILVKLTNRITKLPKIETLPDYQEALKYKNHMSYKLGEALLKGLKTWYKGGLIKFIFEAQKIKKEHKNK